MCTRFSKSRVIFMCWCVCVCVCVIGSVLVLRGRDVWFLLRYFLCYIYVLTVWCVIPLEQVLVWDSFSRKHGQFQTGEGRFCKACTGF
jgi:hypothetical protein